MKTLAEAINDFLKVDRSPSTKTNYSRILARMTVDISGELELHDVTLSRLLDHTEKLAVGIEPSSLFSYVLVIKAFFNWCEQVEYLDRSPARKLQVRKPPVDNADKGIPPDHARAILEEAHKHPRDYALVLFLSETAARIGAVSRLQIGDLNLDACTAKLTEKRRKPVEVDYSPFTAAALRHWLAIRDRYVAHTAVWTRPHDHKPYTVFGLTGLLRRLSFQACGVVHSPHEWRHTLSERWEDMGISIENISHKLNHANTKVTSEFYLRGHDPNVKKLTNNLPLIAFALGADEKIVPGNIICLDECG